MILPQDFYFQDTETVAKQLLGKILHVKNNDDIESARIVEVEAYLGISDPACHTFENRKTERTRSMYLEGGHSYVYLIYGMYHCLNFVTRTSEHPEAVLIRAVQPLNQDNSARKKEIKTNGPGKLCRHYNITRADDGLKLWKKNSRLFVTDDGHKVKSEDIVSVPRIGVDYAGEASSWPLRFYIRNNNFVSKK